ncbi:uncharacterized protein LOC135215372 isoform X4 [Macrobrachium nipponense]|uniref:uncharacterized protein LOC135215372 isoform X4 n=1 Tax=Macrobrachium nipponense TaxID=159736 RepID=UPI0030C8C95B
MRDFLKRTSLRCSSGSSAPNLKKQGGNLISSEIAKEENGDTSSKSNSFLKMRPFRGSVRKKIAELEANSAVKEIHNQKSLASKVTSKSEDASSSASSSQNTSQQCLDIKESAVIEETDDPSLTSETSRDIKDLSCSVPFPEKVPDMSTVKKTSDEASDVESVYESRKLILRRMLQYEVEAAKYSPVDGSEADSWSDLEQNFAKIYEPIPYKVQMEDWNQMTKDELLQNINSQRMKSQCKYMSRKEILDEICHLWEHPIHFLQRREKTDNGSSTQLQGSSRQHKVVAEVHSTSAQFQSDTDSEFGETDYVTRSELYRNIQNLQSSLARHHKQIIEEDSHSWKSLPSQPDDPVYISRSEILSKVDPTYVSQSEVNKMKNVKMSSKPNRDPEYVSRTEILSRLKDMRDSEDERGLSPTNTVESNWDVCSCVSCEQCGTNNSASDAECQCDAKQSQSKKHKEPKKSCISSSPEDVSLLSQDSWSNGEFEKIYEPINGSKVSSYQDQLVNRALEQQEKRLRKLANAEEFRNSGRYLPADIWSLSESEDVYESLARVARASLRRGMKFDGANRKHLNKGDLELQRRVREILGGQKHINTTTRNKVMQAITYHIEHHLDLDDIEDEEERNHEIRERLKEALAQDWETLSNINLGHIYVPMEESTKNSKLAAKENTDYDTFGSIDSLIFEPKVPAENTDETEEAVEFDDSVISNSLLNIVMDHEHESKKLAERVVKPLNTQREDASTEGGKVAFEEDESTPVASPTPSTPTVGSEHEHVLHIVDNSDLTPNFETNDLQVVRKERYSFSDENQHLLKNTVCTDTSDSSHNKTNTKDEAPRLPLKQKLYNGLMGLGFLKSGSKENIRALLQSTAIKRGNENAYHISDPDNLQTKIQKKVSHVKRGNDTVGYESFKKNFQRLSGKRLPSDEDSTYDYHPDHTEALYHGGTTTSHDTADSETDSATSLESVIFKGSPLEKDSDTDEEDKKKKKNSFRHKFVVNHGNESDTSELIENKSLSFRTQPYLDSDTSWDYMEARDDEKAALKHFSAALELQFEKGSATPGPRVVGNMRRKHVYQSVENIERSPTSMSLNDCGNAEQSPTPENAVPNVEDIGDQSNTLCIPLAQQLSQAVGANCVSDDDADGRCLFRAYQRRQFRPPSDPARVDGGGSTSSATHEYEEADIYEICDVGNSLSIQPGQGTPPVVLLKHHVYQSIESLASRSGFSTTNSVKTPATDGTLDGEELHLYGSRHGEPIYGARNSRLFHSMNGAYVDRNGKSDGEPVVIRKGKVVELTEEMFKGTLERNSSEIDGNLNMSFHTTLFPPPPDPETCLYFNNTVSSTESREVHTYENDSEIYGTRKEIREEILQASREKLPSDQDEGNEIEEPPPVPRSIIDHDSVKEDNEVNTQEAAEKFKKVQKVGVSILGNNNDMMIKELKLKLRRKFNTGDEINEPSDGEFCLPRASNDCERKALTATMSSASTSTVALRREQLAPQMSKIFGSFHDRRKQLIDSNCDSKQISTKAKEEPLEITQPKPDVKREMKDGKDKPNEMENNNKAREVIHIETEDGGIEQVYVPTPDYTPASTLPRGSLKGDGEREEEQEQEETGAELENVDFESFKFDLADLAKFVHIHMSKNRDVYSETGNMPHQSDPHVARALYGSQGSLKDPSNGELVASKRSVRFNMNQNLTDLATTWSDLESIIFAEDRSFGSLLEEGPRSPKVKGIDGGSAGSLLGSGKMPSSRMESYKDDNLLWEQLSKMRRSRVPEDRERWELEKTKRMLLWIHLSNNEAYTEICYRSQWWKAKQKASVSWIVQKAHKNKVPSDLQDPYYRDYEGAEHLKPNIVHRLANADLYCSALANIYGDPNFHNLSHWNIIQALARKGVYVAEPTDVALTETVLIQVSPIKMSAHLAVIEAMMALYIREVVVAERAVVVLQRVSGSSKEPERTPQDQEEALVLWINHITQALQERIHQHVQSQEQELPVFPRIQDLSDLSDGIGLAALIAFYCPQELQWGDIAVADPPSIADSIYNIGLVIKFCQDSLPYNPCLLTKEDIVYMHSSIKQNVLAFVAELFFLLELEPVSCVSLPGTKRTSSKFIQLTSPGGGGGCSGWSGYQRSMKVIPDLRASLSPSSAHSTASSSYSSARSSTHSHHRSPYSTLRGRGGVKSPSSGGSGSGSGSGTGVRRQHSLTERDHPRSDRVSVHDGDQEGACGGFNWGSIYPQWWWSCNHEVTDRECIYCWRQYQSQTFGDQYSYYLASAQTCQPSKTDVVPAGLHGGLGGGGGGYPQQGLSYNIPVRDDSYQHSSFSHGLSHERVRARASHPAHAQAYAMKPAGAPSVRRSQSMNLNDMSDIRSRIDQRSENAPSSYNSDYGGRDSSVSDGQGEEFVVQRSRGVSTLSDMMRTQSPRPQDLESHYSSRTATKERFNMDSKEEEMGERSRGLGRRGSFTNSHPDLPAAGMPSRYEERPHGRSRSRRNSISAEDSQLTIENFGGSQDNLNYISRNPDKEPFTHSGRRDSSVWEGSQQSREGSTRPESRSSRERSVERRLDVHRRSIEDLDNRLVDKLEREALEREKRDSSQYTSKERLVVQHPRKSFVETMDSGSESDISFDREKQMTKATSFAELSKLKETLPTGINIIYMQSDREETAKKSNKGSEKKTTFAALPNQTTWKQQSAQTHSDDNKSVGDDMEPQIMASELHNVRLKLEEKRRRIESEKRKMEQAMNKQRQKLGKEAFMQAVVRGGKGSSTGSSTPTTSEPDNLDVMVDSVEQSLPKHPTSITTSTRPNTDLSLQDIGSDVNKVSRRWLEEEGQTDELRTPDLETMDYDEYHKSLTHGESDLEGSRRSSIEYSPAVQLRRQASLSRDPRERGLRDPWVDLRRMSLYLEPGNWRVPYDPSALPPTPPRRVSMGLDSYPPHYRMTDSLTEIQGDIQRLSHQQQQIQSLMQNGIAPQSNPAMQQPPHGQFYLHDQGSPVRRMWGQQSSSDGYSSMSPATRRAQWGPVRPMMPQGDYMMGGQHPGYYQGYPMNHPAQMAALNQAASQQQMPGTGFMLHGQTQSLPPQAMYQNGQGYYSPEHQMRGYPPSAQPFAPGDQQRQMGQTPPFRLHGDGSGGGDSSGGGGSRGPGSLRSSATSSPSRQPPQRQQKSPSPTRTVSHAPVAAPPPDDMEPQNVSFIESEDQSRQHSKSDPSEKLKRLSISSGSKTYRITHEPGSPTRPSIGVKTFRVPTKKGMPVYDDVDLPQPSPPHRSLTPPYRPEDDDDLEVKAEPLQDGPKGDQGFYISFETNGAPKKPKPQLRAKKMSRRSSNPPTPATTPSREEPPVIPNRPSRTSNGSYTPHRGSMSQTNSPSMAQSPPHSTTTTTTATAPSNCQTNGLSINSSSAFGLGEEDDEEHDSHSEIPQEDEINIINKSKRKSSATALIIGDDPVSNENSSASEMEKKKERLMMMSMKRKEEQEAARRKKEMEALAKREAEKEREDEKLRKKEEERARRELILERYKIKKAMEEAEKEGRVYEPPPGFQLDSPGSSQGKPSVRLRNKAPGSSSRPRPKTMAGAPSMSDAGDGPLMSSSGKKGSSQNLADYPSTSRTLERGHTGRRPTSVIGYSSIARGEPRKSSLYGSQGDGLNYGDDYRVHEARRPSLALDGVGSRLRRGSTSSSYGGSGTGYGYKKYRSTGNLSGLRTRSQSEHDSLVYHMSEDSGLGRATPPRRAPSPGMARHLPSPSGPGSLPPGLFSKRRPGGFDDAASDISSTASSTMDYFGPRLFKQPTAKSNRTIILNAVEYCVFPGVVNQTAKHRVLEEIARSESKHFLVLFRDAGCQFRAIYSFNPDTEEVYKLYGTGPKQVNDRMFDKFFKYNSGGKCFSQIHTKHLTVTIDAFTIHNSLWQGKRVNLPSKKDMTLVI